MPHSLASRLLLLLIALIGAALLSSTFAALTAANANVTSLLREDLEVRARVASLALQQQAEALEQRVAVVTADYGFKEAAATGERRTILSALANHGDRLGADLAMWIAPDGDIILSSAPVQRLPRVMDVESATTLPSPRTGLEVLAGRTYLVSAAPVLAPTLTGWLLVGSEIGIGELRTLADVAGAQLSVISEDLPDGQISTMPQGLVVAADAGDGATAGQDEDYLHTTLDAADLNADDSIVIRASVSLEAALAEYDPLRFQLIAIAILALFIAVATSVGASRWITRPIRTMVESAERIADGDYTHNVAVSTGTELDTLGDALSFMQQTVSEREARIQHQAQHDLLTQLPNRHYMYALYQRFLREHPQRAAFGIALMELENLQQIRDLYGSAFCDQVLREASARISSSLRRGDIAGRVGDQQILLFLQGLRAEDTALVLRKIDEVSSEPLLIDGVPVKAELRVGFSFSPAHGSDFDDLQRRAQLALSDARKRGEMSGVYSLGQDEKHLRQIRIANRLQDAIAEGAFNLLYQPKYHLSERKIVGAEALIRWDDRELGPVYPDEFIPIAEQTGIITELSTWVVTSVIDDQRVWRKGGIEIAVSINLSGIDVLQQGFVDAILEQVREADLPVDSVVLEVTETAMMADADAARANMERVERMGMRISIDDYGTGFSSLAQLRTLPVSELKLDKSLVENIDSEAGDRLIVKSTIEMAHHLGLEVVAEGLESKDVLLILNEMGCDTVQGYLLAKPMTSLALTSFLNTEQESTRDIWEPLHAA